MTTFYVDNAPQGAGDHSTPGNAGQFNLVWAKLSPGDIVEVADGTAGDGKYTGNNNMIQPTLLNGASGSPITIQALNDGKPWIDGEVARSPGILRGCTWIDLTGIDFSNGIGTSGVSCFETSHSSGVRTTDCNFRRFCAWDAQIDQNVMVVSVNRSDRILCEDYAAFGTGRKCWQPFRSTFCTSRRGLCYWTGSTRTGPKHALSTTYRSYDNIIENNICIWTAEDQPAETTPDQIQGPMSNDGIILAEGNVMNLKVYGNICIIPGSAVHVGVDDRGALFLIFGSSNSYSEVDLKDNVGIIEPGFHLTKKAVSLLSDATAFDLTSNGITAIGGSGLLKGSQWTSIDEDIGPTLPDVFSVFSSATGAQVCKRYVNGVLTGDNLFPWPMQQRIIDAFVRSGRTGFSVEGELQRLLGTIPAGCITTPPDPDPPDVKDEWIGGGSTDGGALGV